ncbi:cytochrome P450 [Cryphonectria parasitica EP155]|uniref:Cytochrome P450 n=1 Tax=Cryphonectria parasitica (strain ATCC 38755 / EP155) TaxID=660469 RepID=A0A9P4XZ41_CRYP1|nr:cytochrome P450 [Cryphonectria parasitica EP155]KAF3763420.1 cytochrome P450 [Cryphonectria parasitica EP155]
MGVASGLFLLVALRIGWELLFSPLRDFPGPFAAKFTDLWRALWSAKGDIDTTHLKWHRKYDATAVRIGPRAISIGNPDLIRTIYTTKDPWVKSNMYRANDALIDGQIISNIFNTDDNVWHDKHMRPIRSLWTMTKVLAQEPAIDETLSKLIQKLETNFVDGENAGKVCMMDVWLGYFAWDVTANISFGRHYGFLDQERDVDSLIRDSTKGLYYFAPISQIPWVDKLLDKNPIMRIGPKPTLTGIFYAYKVVAEYEHELEVKGDRSTSAEHYLDKYTKLSTCQDPKVDNNQIVSWLMLNVLAGGDTTSATMRAVVYYLAKTPHAHDKLTAELDSARLALPAQWSSIKSLPYLDAVMRESLRINPGIAMIFERIVPLGGLTLPDGRFIPAGTKVGVNPAVTNRDRVVFGADADDFNPDRWLRRDDEDEAEFEVRHKRMRDVADHTFGGGSRVCMGRYFAQLELFKLFATLYSVFDIKLQDTSHKWKYHDAWFVYQWDMPMLITRRQK